MAASSGNTGSSEDGFWSEFTYEPVPDLSDGETAPSGNIGSSGDDSFGEFTNGGEYEVGGSSKDGETASSGALVLSPTWILSEAEILILLPNVEDTYVNVSECFTDKDVSGPDRPYSFLPPSSPPSFSGAAALTGALPGSLEDPETLIGEGVSGPGRLYPFSSPSPPTITGPAFSTGAYDIGENPQDFDFGENPQDFDFRENPQDLDFRENPQDFYLAASSPCPALPLEAPRPIHPSFASWALAPTTTNAGEDLFDAPVWFDHTTGFYRPASAPVWPVAFPPLPATTTEGPPRPATAPSCLDAWAPAWDAPSPTFFFGGDPPTTNNDAWTVAPAMAPGCLDAWAPAWDAATPAVVIGGDLPSTNTNAWFDRPASAPVWHVNAPSPQAMTTGGPPRAATAPSCLDAWAPNWDAPAPAFVFGGAPTTTNTDDWTVVPAAAITSDSSPRTTTITNAWTAAPATITTTDVWTAGPGSLPVSTPAAAWTAAPAANNTSRGPHNTTPTNAWTTAPTAPITTRGAPRTPTITTRGALRTPTTPTRSPPNVLLASTTTTLLRSANAAATPPNNLKRRRTSPATPPTHASSPTDMPPPPPKKQKAGPGRRAKYHGMQGFLVATVADAGELGHKEGPTTMMEAPRSGRWRRSGGKVGGF